MKANEFVKKFGWGAVKKIIKNAPDWAFETAGINDYANREWSKIYPMNAYCKMDDLKRLVESWALVERVISHHNKSLKECQIDIHGLKSLVKKNPKIYPKRLKQAIADVESCQ